MPGCRFQLRPAVERVSQEDKEDEMDNPRVVAPEEWLAARKDLLAQEKEATRAKDAVNAARRALPMTEVTKEYTFTGQGGQASLADLFDGRRQLITYHFMWRHAESGFPSEDQGCPTCMPVTPRWSWCPGRPSPASSDSRSGWAGRCRGTPQPTAISTTTSTSASMRASSRLSTTTWTPKPSSARHPTSGPARTAPGSASSCARVTGSSAPIRPTSGAWIRCLAP